MIPASSHVVLVALASVSLTVGATWLVHRRPSGHVAPAVTRVVLPTRPAPARDVPVAVAVAVGVPMRSVPCVEADVELLAGDAKPVLCSSAGCLAVDLTDGAVAATARPPARTAVPVPLPTKLGPRLRAAIVRATARAATIVATSDRKVVVIGDQVAWSVHGDQPLTLRPPSARYFLPGGDGSVVAMGRTIVATWAACAGPCSQTRVYDARGTVRADGLDGGNVALAATDKTFVLVGERGSVSLLDAGTGAVKDTHELDTYPVWSYDPSAVVVTDGDTRIVAVLRRSSRDVVGLSALEIADDKLDLTVDVQIPVCAR